MLSQHSPVGRTRPRVLAVLPGLFPSTIINVAKPLLRLHAERRIDLTLTFQFVVRRRQVEDTDVLVLCHTIDPQHTHILDSARDLATPLIYDIDENLLEPPPDEPGLEFHAAPARQAAVRRCLEQAALVRTYSPVLKRTLDRFNPEVMRVDGPVDWTLIAEQARPPSARTHIVYATSRVDDLIGRALVGPLHQIVAAHPNVDVTIWGPRLAGLDRHPRVQHRGFIRDYDQYFKEFADAGFDIGLAPMPTDLFYQCKTATKFREYAACRIAGVYSDVEMYRDCVTEGVTGLLVPSGNAGWAAAIGRLIDDDALRRGIQERGEAYARDRYGPGRMEAVWLSGIEQVMRRRDASGARVLAPASTAAAPIESASPMAIAGGLFRQALRHAARVPAVLRGGGIAALWARLRGQVTAVRQLIAWQRALRRMERRYAVAPEPAVYARKAE